MRTLKNSYWANDGKYQNELNELENKIPCIGYTNNKYMNLFLAISHIYYDMYNNGGGNIEDCFEKDIIKYIFPFSSELKSMNFSMGLIPYNGFESSRKLENLIDEVILLIKDKDLEYEKFTIYQNYDKQLLSYEKKEGFQEIVFAEKEEFDKWIKIRTSKSWGFNFI